MRTVLALARVAAIETLAQPLTAVLFLVAALSVHLAGVFHFHQFGEADRLTRECGLSALLVFGLGFATSAAVRTVGRELADGTGAMAMAGGVGRTAFLAGKFLGLAAVGLAFALTMLSGTALAALTALRGAELAAAGEGARMWLPGVAAGVAGPVAAMALAAAANRFLNARFCLWASLAVALSQVAAPLVAPVAAGGEFRRLAPAFATLAGGTLAFVAMAAALSVRWPRAVVFGALGAALVLAFAGSANPLFPCLKVFWAADALAGGGAWTWADAALPLGAAAALTGLWLSAGSLMMEGRELA